MRTVASHLLTSQSLCTMVKIERLDGEIFRFTDADKELVVTGDGTYYPADFMGIGNFSSEIGNSVDNTEVMGAITTDEITEDDLVSRKFAGAYMTVYRADYTLIDSGREIRFVGRIGEITISDAVIKFRAEVLGLSHLLKQKIGLKTTPTCTCKRLGNAQCKVSLVGNTVDGHAIRVTKTITAITSLQSITFGSETAATGYFTKGLVTFSSGVLNGQTFEVKTHTLNAGTAVMLFRENLPELPEIGDTAQLEAGCQRRFAEDCVAKFANGLNFHGFPSIPGNDKISEAGRPPG